MKMSTNLKQALKVSHVFKKEFGGVCINMCNQLVNLNCLAGRILIIRERNCKKKKIKCP